MKKLIKLTSLIIIFCLILSGCGTNKPDNTSIPSTLVLSTTVPIPTATPIPSFDAFIEASYRQLLSRDPETVLILGLSDVFNVPTDKLTDISDTYIRQTQALDSEILSELQNYDREALTQEQQLTYDIYAWYLGDRVRGHEFMYDDYPVNPSVLSIQLSLLQFFTDLRPMNDLQDAKDYVSCLSQVDTKFNQLIDGLKRREERGVILPGFLIDWVVNDLNSIATSSAKSTPYYTVFETKLKVVSSIDNNQKQELLSSAIEAIESAVIPAYQTLVKYLDHLQTIAANDEGVWKFHDGEAYYAYILSHYTTTNLTAEDIHQIGIQALERIHTDMRTIFDQLGYPQEQSLPELFNRLVADSGTYTGDQIVKGYEEIIRNIDQKLGGSFDLRPSIGVRVIGGPTGGYYTPPAVDGSRPGLFYAQNTGIQPKFSMPTLAYHEAVPGHHFQMAISQQLDLPSFRRAADFTAYVEGWALYAEHLVYELGIYASDPYGDLGRLQAEAFRAARLVVDTGIHAKRWTFDQAVRFMMENTGLPINIVQAEVSRYICLPGQATAYYIGYTKILEVRQRAMDELGSEFELKEFHNVLLGSGAMPLDIMQQVIASYIQSKLNGE